MPKRSFDWLVVGGGIVGLATALELLHRRQAIRLAVLEKEGGLAFHQTGHNSGVIHSGVYYRPGSLKARLCREGREKLIRFCDEQGIPYRITGKLIVARDPTEVATLEEILRRAEANNIEGVSRVEGNDIRSFEPHVRGVAALAVASAGIIDYRAVSDVIGREIRRLGGEILFQHEVTAIQRYGAATALQTRAGTLTAKRVIACAGLQCDRLAGVLAQEKGVRIIPFRGDYYLLRPEARHLIRSLVYPVPDPRFPFLGVHFARHIDGEVSAGPNAVLALAREGYGRFRVNLRDSWTTVTWPGFWRMAVRHWRKGMTELRRDYLKWAYWRELRRLVPALRLGDLRRGFSGIRAQAVMRDGTLLDDFLILEAGEVIHVLNAPSPAATSAFAIAREIVDRADGAEHPTSR